MLVLVAAFIARFASVASSSSSARWLASVSYLTG